MTAPGPDGVVCGNGCDAWSINEHCPQHGVSSGPIMACDNAIEHFNKRLTQLAEGERKLLDRLMANRKEQEQLRDSRTQWVNARNTLELALRRTTL